MYAYAIKPAAVKERNLTPFLPKYSFIMSVIMKTIGQSKTPAVRLKDRLS